jgi:hypothetical protein
VAFPFSGAWWALVFNLLLAWEDCAGEWAGESWKILLLGRGAGKDKLGQPRSWETVGWTISRHSSFSEPWVAMRHEGPQEYQRLVELGREAFQASVGPLLVQSN